MKRTLFCILVLFTCIGAFAQQQTVAVTPFEIMSGVAVTQDEADVIYELFITELSNISEITVVDRNSFNRISEQMHFQLSDWSDNNKVLEFGRALNATSIIRGQIMSLGGRMIVNTRVIDVNTTEILSAAPLHLANIVELLDRLPSYVSDVVSNLPRPGLKIGDSGPGGGIIFFAENGRFMEVSGDLGSANWERAVRMARDYRGGGFSDWRLPSMRELELIFRNLDRNNLGGLGYMYWSLEESSRTDSARAENRELNYNYWTQKKDRSILVRAVRSFIQ